MNYLLTISILWHSYNINFIKLLNILNTNSQEY